MKNHELTRTELRALLSIATGPVPAVTTAETHRAMLALARRDLARQGECYFGQGPEPGWRLTLAGMLLASRIVLELLDKSEAEAGKEVAARPLAKSRVSVRPRKRTGRA